MSKYNEYKTLILHYDKKLSKFIDKTSNVQWYKEENNCVKVKFFGNDIFYPISYREIKIFTNPRDFEVTDKIFIDGHELNNYKDIKQFEDWVKIFYYNGTNRVVNSQQITSYKRLKKEGPNAILRFNYYKELAKEISVYKNDFLSSMYNQLNFYQNNTILTKYLSGKTSDNLNETESYIFPFGLNLSQKKAVENVFNNDLSIIEGPPGTGKTQTILNIIANCVIKNKTVAVVSNNNAATTNIEDKMAQYNLDFLIAKLGNKENKTTFFDNRILKKKPMEFLNDTDSNVNVDKHKQMISYYQSKLPNLYHIENRLAYLHEIKKKYDLEYQYFKRDYKIKDSLLYKQIKKKIRKSEQALMLKANLENTSKLSLLKRFYLRLKYGFSFFSQKKVSVIAGIIEDCFYQTKIEELSKEISKHESLLKKENFNEAKKKYQKISMGALKSFLYDKYKNYQSVDFTYDNYRNNFNKFIKEFPVVLSTSYALIPSANKGYIFDYLIIDEASQTDLLSSVLAMSCARKMVVVGDTKQLPQIENQQLDKVNNELKDYYNIEDKYDYFNNNILTSALSVFKDAPKVLLKEHYRCHPMIIGFCNQKYYNNELVVLTSEDHGSEPLKLYKTVPGNHARKNPRGSGLYNQREIDEIKIILENLESDSIGVITPYRYQADLMDKELKPINMFVESDTVHKFQGRAKDIVILSTVANSINQTNNIEEKPDFITRSDLLNVAVSRAKKQLNLIVSDKIFNSKNNDIADLVKYIRYNASESSVVTGKVKSIYDILYLDYQQELMKVRKKYHKESYATEIVTLNLIKSVLEEFTNTRLNVLMHYPLHHLIDKIDSLDENEIKYVTHSWSHVDFAIINRLTKEVVLTIEVDGIFYHEQNINQTKNDAIKDKALSLNGIPILRLKTNESNEEERIKKELSEVLR